MSKNTCNFGVDYDKIWPDINSAKHKINSQSACIYRNNHHSPVNRTTVESKCEEKSRYTPHCYCTTSKDTSIMYCQACSVNDHRPTSSHGESMKPKSTKNDNFPVYWNGIEDFQYSNQNSNIDDSIEQSIEERLSHVKEKGSPTTLQCSTEAVSPGEKQDSLSREEISAQRRLKVAARRRMKKEEKQQLKAIVSGVQVAKPDFSLAQATEDFPALNSTRKVKKTNKSGQICLNSEHSTQASVDYDNCIRTVEKSWKPKKKDPICFSITQALQTKSNTLKSKQVVKKTDQTLQRNILVGNILDGDNPQLKKGKVRPNKVPKPTKLKGIILTERNKKRETSYNQTEDMVDHTKTCEPNVEEGIYPLYTDFTEEISDLLANCAFLETGPKYVPVSEVENSDKKANETVAGMTKGLHSRKFREYCTNCITDDVVASVCALLEKVTYFQDRTFVRDPIKANAKRRYVAGLSQTKKYLSVKKVKLLIIAPDLERNSAEGGLDERIHYFIKEAERQGIPCVFGPNRKRLGRVVMKKALVSCVAVLSYEGAEDEFWKVLEALEKAKLKYQGLLSCQENVTAKDGYVSGSEVTSSLLAKLRGELTPSEKLLLAIEKVT